MDGLPRTEEDGFQHIVFNSENRQQLWDDTLMMSVLPLAKIGKLLDRPHYVEEARRQFMLHIKYLVDRKTGLWFHGWTFDGRHHFAECAVGARQLLGDDRDSGIHRAARPAARRRPARVPARNPPAAGPHAGAVTRTRAACGTR